METNVICTIKVGAIWHTTGSSTVLETIIQYITGVGFQEQQVQSVCGKQNHKM